MSIQLLLYLILQHQGQVVQCPNHANFYLLNLLHIDSKTSERVFGDLEVMQQIMLNNKYDPISRHITNSGLMIMVGHRTFSRYLY